MQDSRPFRTLGCGKKLSLMQPEEESLLGGEAMRRFQVIFDRPVYL